MIAYVDTSALVPLLIAEPSSPACTKVWESADRLVSIQLVEIEAAAALHQAHRMQRIDQPTLLSTLAGLDDLLTDLDLIEIDADLVQLARRCLRTAPLRGYDAMHCAAGWVVSDAPDALLVSGDRQLLTAWRNVGANVMDVHEAPE